MRMLHGVARSVEKINTSLERDPAMMSDRHVFLGLCGPRSDEFCTKCGTNCGYIREARKRCLDLRAMREVELERDEKRHRHANEHQKQRRREMKKNGTDDT